MRRFLVLVVPVLLAFTLLGRADTICRIAASPDRAQVTTSGYVIDLEVSERGWANFDIVDGICQIHIYWDFPGSHPDWLQEDVYVEVQGEYWLEHPMHKGEPEVVAQVVAPTAAPPPSPISQALPWTITPWGAAGEVAGSCYQVTTDKASFLVDCGSFMNTDDMPSTLQGTAYDCDRFPFDPTTIDALVVTHAHDDHVARIHYLVAQGFSGEIHMTEATAQLYRAKLDDALYYSCLPDIRNRATRATTAERIESLIVEHRYLEPFRVDEGVSAMFVDAGHIPGSASIVFQIETLEGVETLTFSGDLGSGHHPFLNPPDVESLSTTSTSTLVVESTYGASDPRYYAEDLYSRFYDVVETALNAGKLVVIPTFALDRTQRVLAALVEGVVSGRVSPEKEIGVGGRSSYCLTEEYIRMHENREFCGQYFSSSFCAADPFAGEGTIWEFVRTSVGNAARETPDSAWTYSVVVTPSGTGSSSYAGELITAYRGDSRVAFIQVGWVSSWSALGQLAETSQVENVQDVFSGHADITGLLEYIECFPDLERVIITHGDDTLGARQALADEIEKVLPDVELLMPGYGHAIPLLD